MTNETLRLRIFAGPNGSGKSSIINSIRNYTKENVVFSHPGKLEFMQDAIKQGYKVYLYFVSIEDPEINVYRVKEVRVKQHGHDVPEDKIRSRYIRTMDLMYSASQLAYRSYYFDNSAEGKDFNLFASFKVTKDWEKKWDIREVSKVPIWFRNYYSAKVTRSIQKEND